MNHGYYGVFNKYTPLTLSHWKLAIDKPLAHICVGFGVHQWQPSADLRLGSYRVAACDVNCPQAGIFSSSKTTGRL